jgi:hypothetical protein
VVVFHQCRIVFIGFIDQSGGKRGQPEEQMGAQRKITSPEKRRFRLTAGTAAGSGIFPAFLLPPVPENLPGLIGKSIPAGGTDHDRQSRFSVDAYSLQNILRQGELDDSIGPFKGCTVKNPDISVSQRVNPPDHLMAAAFQNSFQLQAHTSVAHQNNFHHFSALSIRPG